MKIKLTTKVLFGLILLTGGLLLIRVALSSAFSVDGITLGMLNQQLAAVEKENMLYKEKLYMATSYLTIASDAANLGFAEQKTQLALHNSSSLAIKQ